jgi:predicted O-methyltransferase YrrM
MLAAIERFKQIFPQVYAGDNVILFERTLGFLRDKKFADACRRHAQNEQERSLTLRLNTLVWAASEALRVPGDFVECGVFRGFCSVVIADYLDFAAVHKEFYLYDTFTGIPPGYVDTDTAPPRWEDQYEFAAARFAKFPNVRLIRGVVPDTFAQAIPPSIAFLHIDMNSAKSEIAALDRLFERVSSGGIIIFDDYGWGRYIAQKVAEDAFMRERGHRILELPTGQGLLIKH